MTSWRISVPVLAAAVALGLPGATGGQETIPTPESVLGFPVGADFRLATWDESLAYFRRLDAASDYLRLEEVGRTSEGRPWYIAVISSPGNLANLERFRGIAQRMAHPEALDEGEARALAREGRAFVDISGGLHASEVAGAQHTIQLAHDLVSGAEASPVREILEHVVLFLWPSINPDGQNIVVEWYRSNVGTPWEVAPLPRLYQKYVGHDNNRDAYMLNVEESRVVARTWRHWEPQIIHVHHQSSPFPTRIWLPPFGEPVAPVPPIMARTVNTLGMTMAQALESRGLRGATHMGVFDAWYPGYVDYLPMLQNVAAYWTETALYRYATPRFYTVDDFPADRRDLRAESLYSSPWEGGWWRLGDAVEYMRVASLAVLEYAADHREEILLNRYRSGRQVIDGFARRGPYAYFVPAGQRDPVAAVELLRRLAFNGVRIDRLTGDVTHEGLSYGAGSWVIRTDQEFGELARQLLRVQSYPDLREFPEGPPEQPYDVAGWTLPYLMGVRVTEAREPLAPETLARLEPARGTPIDWRSAVDDPGADVASFDSPLGVGFDTDSVAAGIRPPEGSVSGSGPALALDPSQNNAYRFLNRAFEAGVRVEMEPARPGGDGGDPRGSRYLVRGLPDDVARRWAAELAVRGERTGASGDRLPRPRVALFRPWTASMDEGWTRWLLERFGFAFTNVGSGDIRAGGLADRFDVLVLPDMTPRTILEGFERGTVPPRYAGGIGPEGARALDAFVRAGGTLVCLNGSGALAVEALDLPVRDVVADAGRTDFFASGSILEVETDAAHPVMAGMPARAAVFFGYGPAWTVEEGFSGSVLARYPLRGSPLLSGYLLGEDRINGYAAALDVRHGDGHVVLLGFRPQWRGQTFGTFRVLFNALLFHGEVAADAQGSPDFWMPPPRPDTTAPPARSRR